jgi:hypothetical protein
MHEVDAMRHHAIMMQEFCKLRSVETGICQKQCTVLRGYFHVTNTQDVKRPLKYSLIIHKPCGKSCQP